MHKNQTALADKVKSFVESSNINLGRHSRNREIFIQNLLTIISNFLNAGTKSKSKQTTIMPGQENIISLKPDEKTRQRLLKNQNMTEKESERADRELGTSPFNE